MKAQFLCILHVVAVPPTHIYPYTILRKHLCMRCYHLVSQYVQVPFPIKYHACYTFFWSPLCVVSSKYVEIYPIIV